MSGVARKRGLKAAKQPRAVLHELVDQCEHPQLLLELYYWTVEPHLAELMRCFVMLPRDVQQTLHAFMAMTQSAPDSVKVTISQRGNLTLSSDFVSTIVDRIGSHLPPSRSGTGH
jgi:hypothetical protein